MRRAQRGFLYITTGANGTGKTLFTLKDVRELQLKDGRPVYYTERFEALEPIREFGWQPIKVEDWLTIDHPAIFFFDEAHKDFPLRGGSSKVPPHVLEMAEHRKHGHDFFLNTHLPQKLDVEIRRLVGAPGWHRHLKVAGPGIVREHTYNFQNPNADKPGSGEDAQSRTRIYPKEVYRWYKSAEVHTAKGKIPKQLMVLIACVVGVPLLAGYAYLRITATPKEIAKVTAPGSVAAGAALGAARGPGGQAQLSPEDWMRSRMPRIPAFAHTAPAYDQVTQPVVAPYPAACVIGKLPGYGRGEDCRCWSQQATVLAVPREACEQIARNGFFVDWAQAQPSKGGAEALANGAAPSRAAPVAPGAAAAGDAQGLPGQARAQPVAVAVGGSVADEDTGRAVRAMRAGERRW